MLSAPRRPLSTNQAMSGDAATRIRSRAGGMGSACGAAARNRRFALANFNVQPSSRTRLATPSIPARCSVARTTSRADIAGHCIDESTRVNDESALVDNESTRVEAEGPGELSWGDGPTVAVAIRFWG